MSSVGQVMDAMINYYSGDPRRVNHFLKVYGFAKTIGESEGLSESEQEILEIAALTHDIGIRLSEKKYGSSDGALQQTEGPPEAEKLLYTLGMSDALIARVSWLIAHHHSYSDIEGRDYQILVEADFLVNAYEDEMPLKSIRSVRDKLFKTDAGIAILNGLYEY